MVTSITHGRRVGAGFWWLRFRTPVYERYQISGSSSHAMVRSYWFGVFVPIGNGSAQGPRAGRLRLGSSQTWVAAQLRPDPDDRNVAVAVARPPG